MLDSPQHVSEKDTTPNEPQQGHRYPYQKAPISQNMTSLPVIHELETTAQPPIPTHTEDGGKGFPTDSIFERIDEWLSSNGIFLEEPTESQDAYYSIKKAEVTLIKQKSNSFTSPSLKMGSLGQNLTFNSLYLRRKQKIAIKKRANSGEAGPESLQIGKGKLSSARDLPVAIEERQIESISDLESVQMVEKKIGPNGFTLSTMESLFGKPKAPEVQGDIMAPKLL